MSGAGKAESGGAASCSPEAASAVPPMSRRLRHAPAEWSPGDGVATFRIGGPRAADHGKWERLRQRVRRRIRHGYGESLLSLLTALAVKHPGASRHLVNVSILAETLARRIGLAEPEIRTISVAGLLHDVGKIGIPDAVLFKPGPLTASEYEVVKRHPAQGAEILGSIGFLRRALPMVLHHHERYDGGGYPAGLRGDSIPLGARILHVADSVDAMRSARSYRPARSPDEVIRELERCAGTQFDPCVAREAIHGLRGRPAVLGAW